MNLEDEIVACSENRPLWQRQILHRLARGEALSDEGLETLALSLAAGASESTPGLSRDDFPGGGGGPRETVRIRAVRGLQAVNALASEQTLEFAADGLTVVYGDNASGKSGYARIVKAMVRARHREEVRSDIFNDKPPRAPAATIVAEVGGRSHEFTWPETAPSFLASVGFYDEACGDKYLTTDTEISYRPAPLMLFDALIKTCDRVKDALEQRLADNAREARPVPSVAQGTRAYEILANIPSATKQEIEELFEAARSAPEKLVDQRENANRLRRTNPVHERDKLLSAAAKWDAFAQHAESVAFQLGTTAAADLGRKHQDLRVARAAARQASAATFDEEPLQGVGSSSWRVLWDAAKAFATSDAGLHTYPPAGTTGRCVLCHQELAPGAADRLRRFETFVQDRVQGTLRAAEAAWTAGHRRLQELQVETGVVTVLLESLAEDYPVQTSHVRDWVRRCAERRQQLCDSLNAETWSFADDRSVELLFDARGLASECRARADAVNTKEHQLKCQRAESELRECEAYAAVQAHRSDIEHEIHRWAQRRQLENAKQQTSTNAISTKSAELIRAHVTTVVRDRFTRETDRLRLERVTLSDMGVRKGMLRHQASFVGARQDAPLPAVLSEGEQTALGLAGFFTEAYLDPSRSAIVLDDPVCSLDHRRRVRVAERLAEFAKDRQVVVFTHDVALVADLTKAAREASVPITERSIERLPSGAPGACRTSHPWKAKDASQRVDQLTRELRQLYKDQQNLEQDEYEARVADWAGKLSETWERVLVNEVVGQVFDLGVQEVRPAMFRVLAKVTEQDNVEFQASYTRCSQWARRHDKSLATNYVAPLLNELEDELKKVKFWLDRVKKYKN